MLMAPEHFDNLPAPRVGRRPRHIHRDFVALRILAVIGGAWARRSRQLPGQVWTRERSGCSVIVSVLALACSHDKTGVELDSGGDPYSDRAHTIAETVDDPRSFVSIDSGDSTFCATSNDGTVLCKSTEGSSGWRPKSIEDNTPTASLEDVSVFADGIAHACGRESSNGQTTCWGCDDSFSDACGSFDLRWTMARPFYGMTCYIEADGQVACLNVPDGPTDFDPNKWSDKTFPLSMDGGGALCASWSEGTDCIAEEASWFDEAHGLPSEESLVQISVGKYHACGLDADGIPTCWGDESAWTGLPSEPMSVIMADLNTCFIRAGDGSVDCVPAYLRPPEGVFVDVASYDGHPIAVREDGALVEWMLDPAYDTGIPLDE